MYAWQAINKVIWKSLEYSLPVTSLSDAQCHAIMAPALIVGLSKAHICRNFPRALIHVSTSNLGAGVANLCTTQGIKHLELLMSAGHAGSLTGKLLRASFDAFFMGCGVGRNICNPKWKAVMTGTTTCWIRDTIVFLQINGLELRHDINIPTLCNNAVFLMAHWETNNATDATLVWMNRYR
jgi:hypothetical protein